MKISIIMWIYNRVHLLKYSLRALEKQLEGFEIDLHVADDGSTDGLDHFLQEYSRKEGWAVYKYDTSRYKEAFNNAFNCPAPYYNALVAICNSDYIIKIDPEFVIITEGFVKKSIEILEQGRPAIVMPLPHHVDDFEYESFGDMLDLWSAFEYPTHINKDTALHCNVYYGCMFSRKAYIELGGIDFRFKDGIGSEDDHLLDQWRRKYGEDNVITLLDEHGLHLFHGGFSKGVPQELYHHVNKNADLRRVLKHTYPNAGDMYCVNYPDLPYVAWVGGVKVVESGNVSVNNNKINKAVDDGFVIGYVDR